MYTYVTYITLHLLRFSSGYPWDDVLRYVEMMWEGLGSISDQTLHGMACSLFHWCSFARRATKLEASEI